MTVQLNRDFDCAQISASDSPSAKEDKCKDENITDVE